MLQTDKYFREMWPVEPGTTCLRDNGPKVGSVVKTLSGQLCLLTVGLSVCMPWRLDCAEGVRLAWSVSYFLDRNSAGSSKWLCGRNIHTLFSQHPAKHCVLLIINTGLPKPRFLPFFLHPPDGQPLGLVTHMPFQ